MIESSRASGRAMLCGIARYSHHHGSCSFYWETGGLERAWPRLRALDLDGIILRDGDKLDEVLDLEIPAVVVGHSRQEISGLVNVVTDSQSIGTMAAEHLMQCGFRHFAYCGRRNTPWSDLRLETFGSRIRESGHDLRSYTDLGSGDEAWREEHRALAAWLRSLPRPVGLMACNDDCGQQVLEACKLAGLQVPDEVGVIGADNDEVVCGLSDPPLSSVAINFEQAGYAAAEMLFRLMLKRQRSSLKISVPATHIVARRSTDFVAVSDTALAKVLRMIRDGAQTGGSRIDELSCAAGMSRRALEKRFQQELGTTIHNHVRKVRSDKIAQLLVETELPVGRIAESLGFADFQHFARYFRSAKGISPMEYRKKFGTTK